MSTRRLACVIGWPVSQSLSPAIHNAAFEAAGLDWVYGTLAVPPGAAREALVLAEGLEVAGANVTMPHKSDIAGLLPELSPEAGRLGAVNTIVRAEGRSIGHNTDGEGFVRALQEDGELELRGARALVLGAGGAARAVALALAEAGALVTVRARRRAAADAAASLHPAIVAGGWEDPVPADLVVNATPVRSGLPIGSLGLRTGMMVVDLITQAPRTELLRAADAAGARGSDGIGMLVHQAALAFELWTGTEAPLAVMRAAAQAAAGGR